jgi:hypothetical protein
MKQQEEERKLQQEVLKQQEEELKQQQEEELKQQEVLKQQEELKKQEEVQVRVEKVDLRADVDDMTLFKAVPLKREATFFMNVRKKIERPITLLAFKETLKQYRMVYVTKSNSFAIFNGVMAGTQCETSSGEYIFQKYSRGQLLVHNKPSGTGSGQVSFQTNDMVTLEINGQSAIELTIIGFTAHSYKENSYTVHLWSQLEMCSYRCGNTTFVKFLNGEEPALVRGSKVTGAVFPVDSELIDSYYRASEYLLKAESPEFEGAVSSTRANRLRIKQAEKDANDRARADALEKENQAKAVQREAKKKAKEAEMRKEALRKQSLANEKAKRESDKKAADALAESNNLRAELVQARDEMKQLMKDVANEKRRREYETATEQQPAAVAAQIPKAAAKNRKPVLNKPNKLTTPAELECDSEFESEDESDSAVESESDAPAVRHRPNRSRTTEDRDGYSDESDDFDIVDIVKKVGVDEKLQELRDMKVAEAVKLSLKKKRKRRQERERAKQRYRDDLQMQAVIAYEVKQRLKKQKVNGGKKKH